MTYNPRNMFSTTGIKPPAGAFGSIPNPAALPPSPYEQVANLYPNINNLRDTAGNVINEQLAGKVSGGTRNAIFDAAASRGVGNGLDSRSGFNLNNALYTVGKTSEQLQNQGTQNYESFLSNLYAGQLNPDLIYSNNVRNSNLAAAPDPAAAAAYQLQLMDKYISSLSNPAGGTGRYAPSGGGANIHLSGGRPTTGFSIPEAQYGQPRALGAGGVPWSGYPDSVYTGAGGGYNLNPSDSYYPRNNSFSPETGNWFNFGGQTHGFDPDADINDFLYNYDDYFE